MESQGVRFRTRTPIIPATDCRLTAVSTRVIAHWYRIWPHVAAAMALLAAGSHRRLAVVACTRINTQFLSGRATLTVGGYTHPSTASVIAARTGGGIDCSPVLQPTGLTHRRWVDSSRQEVTPWTAFSTPRCAMRQTVLNNNSSSQRTSAAPTNILTPIIPVQGTLLVARRDRFGDPTWPGHRQTRARFRRPRSGPGPTRAVGRTARWTCSSSHCAGIDTEVGRQWRSSRGLASILAPSSPGNSTTWRLTHLRRYAHRSLAR